MLCTNVCKSTANWLEIHLQHGGEMLLMKLTLQVCILLDSCKDYFNWMDKIICFVVFSLKGGWANGFMMDPTVGYSRIWSVLHAKNIILSLNESLKRIWFIK